MQHPSDTEPATPRADAFGTLMAAIVYPPSFDIDGLLLSIAKRLAAAGWQVGGVVQSRTAMDGCAGMLLEDIRTGARRSIAQDLGRLSTSCKLDTAAMAEIAGNLERQVDAGLDLLIVNRFGKLEFDGGGLRSVVARAAIAGLPVLTAVRDINDAAWVAFHGGLGRALPPDEDAVCAWAEAVLPPPPLK